jgi:aspartyl-tRNA(Asn)/glutamyl-tRNA(Gln) amidotransferase subunit B
LVSLGTLSSRGAKDTLALFVETGQDPEDLARDHGLLQIQDKGQTDAFVEATLAEEHKAFEELKAGKEAALQYLVGKTMKKSQGAGNPELIRAAILGKLG